MNNIFTDIKTAIKLTGEVRKARKAGAVGMKHAASSLYPSFLEVKAAKAVFIRRIQSYAPALALPESHPAHMSIRTAIGCASAEVWQQGRRYQRDQDTSELLRLAGWEKKSS